MGPGVAAPELVAKGTIHGEPQEHPLQGGPLAFRRESDIFARRQAFSRALDIFSRAREHSKRARNWISSWGLVAGWPQAREETPSSGS